MSYKQENYLLKFISENRPSTRKKASFKSIS